MDTTVESVPESGCVRVTSASYFGIPLGMVTLYDCREPDTSRSVKADYGETLWSGERAAYALGLRKGWGERYDRMPESISTYWDLRKSESAPESRRILGMLLDGYRRLLRDYESGVPDVRQGGGVCYRPVAIYLANYGGGVICDGRQWTLHK